MTQDTQAGAGAQPAPAIQPVYLPLQQECADYATSLRSTTMQLKLEGRPEPLSMVRAAELFERAAAHITQLDASASQLIEERDHAQDMADRLAQAISEEFRVDVGDHSNLNCPWHQALAVLNGEYTTDSDKDRCIAVQAGELVAARTEAQHWRSNHDNVVARLRIFTQRPDIPKELADRLPWYRELVRLQEVEAQAAAKGLHQGADAAAVAALKGLLSLVRREAPQLSGKVLGDAESAIAALQAAPPAPAFATLPEGWTACRIEHEPGYPEDVAFGPKIMMDRLKKWLDRHFAALAAAPAQAVAVPDERVAFEAWGRSVHLGLERVGDRPYYWQYARWAWDAWQARATLPATPAQEHATQLAGQGQDALQEVFKRADRLIDVMDDYDQNAPEHRSYVSGAYEDSLNDLRRAVTAARAAPAQAQEDAGDANGDKALLDFLRDTCCDLRSIDVPTGGDDSYVHWRVIEHHMSEPREREIGRSWTDDPREAIRAARAAQGGA